MQVDGPITGGAYKRRGGGGGRGGLISGGAYNRNIFSPICLQVDGPITGGAYKQRGVGGGGGLYPEGLITGIFFPRSVCRLMGL